MHFFIASTCIKPHTKHDDHSRFPLDEINLGGVEIIHRLQPDRGKLTSITSCNRLFGIKTLDSA